MDLAERLQWLRNEDDPLRLPGTRRRESVSNLEIWCECFGRPRDSLRRQDAYELAGIMKQLSGWENRGRIARQRIPIYGVQQLYHRR